MLQTSEIGIGLIILRNPPFEEGTIRMIIIRSFLQGSLIFLGLFVLIAHPGFLFSYDCSPDIEGKCHLRSSAAGCVWSLRRAAALPTANRSRIGEPDRSPLGSGGDRSRKPALGTGPSPLGKQLGR